MISQVYILFIFLANGNVAHHDFVDLKSCLVAQSAIHEDHEIRGDRSIATMLCLPEDQRALFIAPDPPAGAR